jgi:hypothetical protein
MSLLVRASSKLVHLLHKAEWTREDLFNNLLLKFKLPALSSCESDVD